MPLLEKEPGLRVRCVRCHSVDPSDSLDDPTIHPIKREHRAVVIELKIQRNAVRLCHKAVPLTGWGAQRSTQWPP
jgi:hypothetical protein